MIITREKGMRMWGGGSGNTSVSGASSGGGFSLTVAEGEGSGNAYTDFTYESGTLTLNKATEFVTVDFFNKLFTAYDANGNVIAPNNTTPTLDNIKFKAGAWTEQYLSALGQNSSGGGGGGGGDVSSIIFDTSISYHTGTPVYTATDGVIHLPPYPTSVTWANVTNKPSWIGSSKPTYSLSEISGTDDLQAIEGLTGTSGLLKKTAANTWTLDTNTYALASDVYSSSASRTKNYVLAAPSTANGAATFRKLVASDIPDLSSTYATDARADTLEGYFNTGGVAKVAAKLNTGTTTYTAWGQTYWSSGVPQSISGNMTSVGSITPSANGNALGTTSARFAIYGTSGNYSSTLTVADAITLSGSTAAKKRIYFGDTSHYIELTSTGFHFSHGVYSDSFISALGANSSGGDSGTFDEEAMWTALGTTSTAKVIASSHIPNLSASKITSGTFAAARIPDLSSKYLPLTGGTLQKSSGDTPLYIKTTNASGAYIGYKLNDDTTMGFIGVHATLGASYVKSGTVYPILRSDNYSSYALPLTGGTMTGSIKMDAVAKGYYLVDSAGVSYPALWDNGSYLCIGANAVSGTHHTGSTYISAGSGEVYISRLVNNSRTSYKNLDAGNTYVSSGIGYINGNEITTISGNAATATTLATPRTIWGQSFDGSANITGELTDVTEITMSSHLTATTPSTSAIYLRAANNNGAIDLYAGTSRGLYNSTGSTWVIATNGTNTWLSQGNVGIGTISPSYKLDVSGDIRASGSVYVGTNGAYVGSTSTTNILLQNSSGSVLVGDSKVVRRGTSSSMADVTLGSSTYPWGGLYSTTGHFSSTLSVSGKATMSAGLNITGSTDNYSQGIRIHDADNLSSIFFRASGETGISAGMVGITADSTGMRFRLGSSNTATTLNDYVKILYGGNVGIGNASPSQKLHVTGNILASGEVTASSDERLKTIVGDGNLDLRYIANAPNILFKWNNGQDNKVHGGSLAQYFLHGAKHFVLGNDKDYYSLNYGALATSMAISIAKAVVTHEDEITRLKKEVVKLRERVAELEERRIA